MNEEHAAGKILITGASGFLGRRTAEYYRERYEVFMPGHQEMDITDVQSVGRYMEGHRPDTVIHCAAVSDVGACAREPEHSRKVNVDGSRNIARICREIGAKCILSSSDQVYFKSPVSGPHSEDEVLNPGNEYGRQKLLAEQSCLQINPDCVFLRLSWMYDAASKSEWEHGDFLRTLLANLREGRELVYPVYDVRGITDVNQVIRNLEKAWKLPGGVWNFGSFNDRSTFDTMEAVFSRLNCGPEIISKLKKNKDAFSDSPRDISMDPGKRKRYGIEFTDTAEGLCAALEKSGVIPHGYPQSACSASAIAAAPSG
ncbi:MAG: sugar nucleotide-binding protein [Lachnospiraceae bacterium]|nr:sugar nucleotide-binding protein [Lachnospiraceae bacterium]